MIKTLFTQLIIDKCINTFSDELYISLFLKPLIQNNKKLINISADITMLHGSDIHELMIEALKEELKNEIDNEVLKWFRP